MTSVHVVGREDESYIKRFWTIP